MIPTPYRDEIIAFLRHWFAKNEAGPSFEEIGAAVGVQSRATILRHLRTLRGVDVEWVEGRHRSIRLLGDTATPQLPTPWHSVDLQFAEPLLSLLASGVVALAALPSSHNRGEDRRIVPPALRLAHSRICYLALLAGLPAPDLRTLLEWLAMPLSAWPVHPAIEELDQATQFLRFGSPTAEAIFWARPGADPLHQYHEQFMESVITLSRNNQFQSAYTAFRRFLIEHPVISLTDLQTAIFTRQDLGPLASRLREAYVPSNMVVGDSVVYLCPGCGYLLRPLASGQPVCHSDRCERQRTFGEAPAALDQSQPHMALRPGVYRYVVLPGLPELALFKALEAISGLQVTLWPECDAYDIGITFPDGTTWAVDMKDWGHLSRFVLETNPVRRQPLAHQTVVAFPDYASYLHVRHARPVLEPMLDGIVLRYAHEVVSEARSHMQRCKAHA